MNTRAFLRWASVNILLGGWDTYFATPSNYYLYNSGREGKENDFIAAPYFTFIPWDYDNCLGIDYFGVRWQYANILDWPSSTIPYWKNRRSSRIPLVQNLLSNRDYLQYYADHMEYVLDTMFSPRKIAAQIGEEFDGGLSGPGPPGGLSRIRHSRRTAVHRPEVQQSRGICEWVPAEPGATWKSKDRRYLALRAHEA